MRVIVMLNPTNKYGTKGAYTKLRKFLESDGYIMLQPEVFMRIATNRKSAEKHLRRLEDYNPKTGQVRVMKLTEKQFQNIWMLSGELDRQEEIVGNHCHIVL